MGGCDWVAKDPVLHTTGIRVENYYFFATTIGPIYVYDHLTNMAERLS